MNLSIIHIEDEYREFLNLASFVKTVIEDFWEARLGHVVIAKLSQLAQSGGDVENWVVYEIVADAEPDQRFRYIFVRDHILSPEICNFFFEHKVFILDVLRPMEGMTKLGVSVHDSLDSIEQFVDDHSNVVLFTAHQGNGLDHDSRTMPRKISKESKDELGDFLASAVLRYLDHG